MKSSLIVGTVSAQFKRIRESVTPELKLKNELHQNTESVTPQLQEQS
jgi:hypothetical protein